MVGGGFHCRGKTPQAKKAKSAKTKAATIRIAKGKRGASTTHMIAATTFTTPMNNGKIN